MENKFFIVHEQGTNSLIGINSSEVFVIRNIIENNDTYGAIYLKNGHTIKTNEKANKLKVLINEYCPCIDVHGFKANTCFIIPKMNIIRIEDVIKKNKKCTKIYLQPFIDMGDNNLIVNESVPKIVKDLNG